MDYPFWDVDIGYGILMAIIAVIHVFVSHFAIGGGLYLVVAESSARKKNDTLKLEFLKKLSKFFVLVTVVFGALTGVGIWFVIGLLNPAATEALIHNFVWGWATEWTFFVIEITAAIIYFYGWEKMSAKNHLTVGWLYFGAAWLSLFIINGILSFMLTPGTWLATGAFWDGFFNPTFFSSLVFRTGICIMLAGIFALVVASRYPADETKKGLVRYNTYWALTGMIIMLPSLFWFVSTIPQNIIDAVWGTHLTPIASMNASYINFALLALVLIIFGLLIPKRFNIIIAVVAMIFGLSYFGEFEWMRESIRKPYVIYGYMYGNGIWLGDADKYAADGYLDHIKLRTNDRNRDLFNHACRSCHTMNGYKALAPHYDGTDIDFIAGTIRGAHVMLGNMPEFLGTDEETRMVATHIYNNIDNRPFAEINSNLSGVELGKKVYDIRCGKCHIFGGLNDKAESILGLNESEYNDLLDMAGDFADEMPPFTGDQTEREALIKYLMSLSKGGTR